MWSPPEVKEFLISVPFVARAFTKTGHLVILDEYKYIKIYSVPTELISFSKLDRIDRVKYEAVNSGKYVEVYLPLEYHTNFHFMYYVKIAALNRKLDTVIEAIECIYNDEVKNLIYNTKIVSAIKSLRDEFHGLRCRYYPNFTFWSNVSRLCTHFGVSKQTCVDILIAIVYVIRNKTLIHQTLETESEMITFDMISKLRLKELAEIFKTTRYKYPRILWVCLFLAKDYEIDPEVDMLNYTPTKANIIAFLRNPVNLLILSSATLF